MPPSNFKRKWIKLFIDECLTGTIREDLSSEERGVWYDFLLLAGRNRPPGAISANETTAISPTRLAALLNIKVTLLARAIDKFESSGRVTIEDNGILHIVNWDKYQYTDYDRQKPIRKRSYTERHQEYLRQHPEKIIASDNMNRADDPSFALVEIEDGVRDNLARGDTPLEVHEAAMLKANPHVFDHLKDIP